MKKYAIFLYLIFFSANLVYAQEAESTFDNREFELGVLSFNLDQLDLSGDNKSVALEILSLYLMFGDAQLDKEGLDRNRHGFVAHAGLGGAFSSTTFDTGFQTETITATSMGIHAGAGYGVKYNDLSGYGTINTGVISIFNSDALDGAETNFFPSNSAFLRLAGLWRSPIADKGGTSIGIHTALDISLSEGGGSALLIGVSVTPK